MTAHRLHLGRVEGMEDQKEIRGLAERTGMTEDEARVLRHLKELGNAWHRVPNINLVHHAMFSSSYQTIAGLLAQRVVKRDHPEGWRTHAEAEAEMEEGGNVL
jgi:hypothetical protein